MADLGFSDGDPTVRTLLRRVLETADSRTPRRRRSTQTNAQRRQSRQSQTPYSTRQGSQTKTSARKQSRVTRSVGRSTRVQGRGHLEEQTPRTLLRNILLTAPESSTVMPDPVVKPAQVPEVPQSSRRESSWGSLELHLPDLEPPSTLAPGLTVPGKRKQKLRLSVFQQEVNQGLPLSQEPRESADISSLASSFNLTFAPPGQPETVERPGLARRRPIRRLVNASAFLQDLEDNSLTSAPPGDSQRTPGAAPLMDVGLEDDDTQPFSQPLADSSLSGKHSLPKPSRPEVEDTERVVGPGTPSSGTRLQNQMSRTASAASPLPFLEPQPQPEKLREAVGSNEAAERKDGEGSSGHEETCVRPASGELSSSAHDSLPAEQPRQLHEPPPSPGAAVLSSEPLESVTAKCPSRTGTAGPRHRHDPHKAGLSHYVKLFSFYTKMPVEKRALEIVEKCLDKYFQHLCNDLEVFAAHAGRKIVKPKDLLLLMRRQGLVTDQISLHVLVERYLPLEYRQQLIPCAFSGNSVFPAQ
ncbi:centromere protein T [Mus pahari]|uniref:centromere protein T n=1 Tax=Mus pahari TaxID=10093 RepID=UPI000A3100BA|nr:centromere protein T [Mus pahari]